MIPKFRAWLKDEQRMIESYDTLAIDYENEEIVTQKIYFERGLAIERDIYSHDFDDVNLMQSTGLFDENGKEIFNGDIVLIYGEKISKVFYSQGSFCVDILNGGTPLHGFSPKQLEVIGNIYDNKDLLGE